MTAHHLTPKSRLSAGSSASGTTESADLPLWSIGFRPFFFGATFSAVVLVPLWLLTLEGAYLTPYWIGSRAHAHEMLFGFATAVIAGFLLTAASNWTGQPTATGRKLGLLVALWASGRVLPLVLSSVPVLVAVVDLAFVPALGFVLAGPLLKMKSRRNYVFIVLLGLLFVANVGMHLEQHGIGGAELPPAAGQTLALRVITLMILVVGGRVIPMFTRNGAGRPEIETNPRLDVLGAFAFLVAAAAGLLLPGSTTVFGLQLVPLLWIAAGLLNLLRMAYWGSRHATTTLLISLHAGFFATSLSFVFEGLWGLGLAPQTTGLHLLTVGGIGLLTLGMMTRVSLGHSGRMLVAPKSMALATYALMLAAAARAFGPLIVPDASIHFWRLSGSLWTLAFVLLLRFGIPIWTTPRADAPSDVPRRREAATVQAPREHGFWVMLAISLSAGFLSTPSVAGLMTAFALALATTAGAAVVGKRIRKNAPLQTFAATLLGTVAAPVVLAGGGTPKSAFLISLVLSVAFLAGAFAIRSVLEAARRRLASSLTYRAASLFVPAIAGGGLLLLAEPRAALATLVPLTYSVGLALSSPSAKRLKAIGLSISVAHMTAALLMSLWAN